ncbi:MAG: TetR/AcrR family transcriptional regulator, partial [Deltaproteobacteria bacterium]|nr:TetR/AcrR family transcriptional regulator [Deltaproteobacteria bacterium]
MWEIRAMTKHLPEPVRRRQILDAARRAFVDKGYFPTRMEDIAQAAGLSKGGLYCHFDSKRRIFEALVEQEYKESSAQLKRIAAEPGSYQERFAKLGKHFMDFFRRRPDYPRFFMIMGEMAGREESIRALLAGLQKEYIR